MKLDFPFLHASLGTSVRTGLLQFVLVAAASALTACGGGETTDNAVAVIVPVSIATQPGDQAVVAGAAAAFSVSARGDSPSYQWQRSTDAGATWSNISGANGASYSVGSADTALNGNRYRVVVTGAGNSVTSAGAALSVSAAPVAPQIAADVGVQKVAFGANASFSVDASGTALTYQWQSSTDGLTWVNIPGATSATLTLTAPAFADNGKRVRAVVSNSAGSVTSTVGVLTVDPGANAPVITSAPQAQSLVAGPGQFSFNVVATGTPAPTFVWQRSNDAGTSFFDISDGASYNSSAIALTDNGALFRVVATNAEGSVTSPAVLLTVSAAVVAPVISAQPKAVSVVAPATATFSVIASATPTPTYQWQISRNSGATYSNIASATASSYTTGATSATDNGALFRVLVNNGNTAVTSTAAGLTATAATVVSGLTGRSWTPLASLETDDNSVGAAQQSIDDLGRTVVVFVKSNGTRPVLYAQTRTPGAAGVAPSSGAPVALDTLRPIFRNGSAYYFGVASAPNGSAVAMWAAEAPCTSTTYRTTGTCRYVFSSSYSTSTGTWEVPLLVGSTPSLLFGQPKINNAGDIAVSIAGWDRPNPAAAYVNKITVATKAAANPGFQQQFLPDGLRDWDYGLDSAGNLIAAGNFTQNATTDIVAYRGNVTSGFGAQEILDARGAAADFKSITMGLNGQTSVVWTQSNGVSTTNFAAVAPSAAGAFVVTDIDATRWDRSVVTDDGVVILYEREFYLVRKWSAGAWLAAQNMPSGFVKGVGGFRTDAIARNGDVITTGFGGSGKWYSYAADKNLMVQSPGASTAPSADYLFGFSTDGGFLGGNSLVLSVSGVGSMLFLNKYDVLPTIAAPSGDSRTINNLWGAYLK
jgi:hypothetical protein